MANNEYFDWFIKKLGKKIPETDYADYVDLQKLGTEFEKRPKLGMLKRGRNFTPKRKGSQVSFDESPKRKTSYF